VKKTFAPALLLIALQSLFVSAADQPKRPIVPDDIVNFRLVTDPQISPDGKQVAFVAEEPLAEKRVESKPNSEIWIVPSDGTEDPRRFAFGPRDETMPRWSLDGKYFAFLSDRQSEGKNQIYILSTSGGEPEQLTNISDGVVAFQWVSGSTSIAFTANEEIDPEKKKKQEEGEDELTIDEEDPFIMLYQIDLKSRKQERISSEHENINDFDYSPNGPHVAISVSKTPNIDDVFFRSQVVVMSLADHSRKILSDQSFGTVRWFPDGQRVLHLRPVDSNRLGIGGWSYGGFMTSWAVTQTSRFRAAVMGAGVSDLISEHGTDDIPSFTKTYFGRSPFDDPALYQQRSTIYFVKNVKTPTLILHGQEDRRVPLSQGIEFYRALSEHGSSAL